MRAVALLSVWKIKNSFRSLFSDPRKLIPVVLMIVFLAFPFSMWLIAHNMMDKSFKQLEANQQRIARQARLQGDKGAATKALRAPFEPARPQIDPEVFSAGIFLTLILVGIGVVNTGLGDRLLALGASDVDYLFPAPISRRVVLAYRLPSLTFGAVGMAVYLLLMIGMFTQVPGGGMPGSGTTVSPWWVNPAALFFSGGIYLNLAMLIAIQFPKRQTYQRVFWLVSAAIVGSIGLMVWINGIQGVEFLLKEPVFRWVFLPSSLASDTLVATYSQHAASGPLSWLFVGYLGSVAIMLCSNANWYEQSIASTERMTALRQAAKGGMSGIMAVKAASFKYKGVRPYTVAPFGQGGGALFWAHLCAAAKKPFPNFVVPLLSGIILAAASSYGIHSMNAGMSAESHLRHTRVISQSLGYTIVGFLAFYSWQIFTTTSRTASEGSIRRRELIAPLPIPGWQAVAADLGVPFFAILLCYEAFALSYLVLQGSNWPIVAFVFAAILPLRLGSRIVLQHIVVIAYPDLADKIQRLVSLFVNAVVGFPFLVLEGVVCLPGLLLHSIWAALIPLALVQIPLGALFLALAGKASEKAIATGEPVNIFRLFRGRA